MLSRVNAHRFGEEWGWFILEKSQSKNFDKFIICPFSRIILLILSTQEFQNNHFIFRKNVLCLKQEENFWENGLGRACRGGNVHFQLSSWKHASQRRPVLSSAKIISRSTCNKFRPKNLKLTWHSGNALKSVQMEVSDQRRPSNFKPNWSESKSDKWIWKYQNQRGSEIYGENVHLRKFGQESWRAARTCWDSANQNRRQRALLVQARSNWQSTALPHSAVCIRQYFYQSR